MAALSHQQRALGGTMIRKRLSIFFAAGLLLVGVAPSFATDCNDGSHSNSTGRGTCSHHGGEAGNGR
jgi:hypothetical protein